MKTPALVYHNTLPKMSDFPADSLFIYDRRLLKYSKFKKWINGLPNTMPVTAGEGLKSLQSFQEILSKIENNRTQHQPQMTFVAVGGGSVGDFVGFLASVYKRGRPLIHVPTTWLASVDSSHGGKNALNSGRSKNQIGTFWPAQKIVISKALLLLQPQARTVEAMGELIKIAIINNPVLFKRIEKLRSLDIWPFLPDAIQSKYQIVKQDPLEKKGLRRLLNLGHTVGHIFESELGIPHGQAILGGLYFSLNFSSVSGLIDIKDFIKIEAVLNRHLKPKLYYVWLSRLSEKQFLNQISKDKKRVSTDSVDFIFIKKVNQVLRAQVSLFDLLQEFNRQKELRV